MTKGQLPIFTAICIYTEQYDVSPTYAEIAALCNCKPPTAYEHVVGLEKRGYLDRIDGLDRGIELTNKGEKLWKKIK